MVISVVTKQWITDLKGPSNDLYSATFASDGRLFASYAGGVVIVWDLATRTCTHTFTNSSLMFATDLDISPDGDYLAYGTTSGIVDVFLMKDLVPGGPAQPKVHKSIANLVTPISTVKFNHDTQILAIASDGKKGAIRLVHVPSFQVFPNFPLIDLPLIKDVTFSPSSGFMLTGENPGNVRMYRLPHYPSV